MNSLTPFLVMRCKNESKNNNWVVYSTEGSAFQDGGNTSNKNIGI